MQKNEQPTITKKINDCTVTLSFTDNPNPKAIDVVKSILSNAYNERVQNELKKLADMRP